jgi:hypothetical protein
VRKGECVTNLFMLSALLVLSFPARCVCTVCGCQLMGRLPVLQATRGPKGWMRNLFDVLELPDSRTHGLAGVCVRRYYRVQCFPLVTRRARQSLM